MDVEDKRRELRRDFALHVTKALVSPEFRSSICGSSVVIALPDDRMGDVFAQVSRNGQDCTSVVAPTRDGFAIALFSPAEPAIAGAPEAADDDCVIHEQSEVSLFFDYLRSVRSMRCRLVDPARDVELIDDGGELVS